MKKIRKGFALVTAGVVFSIIVGLMAPSQAQAKSAYKLTKYKSYKSLVNGMMDKLGYIGGIDYIFLKLKTKYGTTKVAVLQSYGTTADCKQGILFVKRGGKIYQYSKYDASLDGVSKDRKYLYTYAGLYAGAKIYKYNAKTGCYKLKEKCDCSSGDEATNKKALNRLKKKYKIIEDNGKWKWKSVPNPAFS